MSHDRLKLNQFFGDNLILTLKLECDGKEVELSTQNIEEVHLKLRPYGFTSHLLISTFDDDEADGILTNTKPIKATLAFMPTDILQGTEPLVELKGIITENITFQRVPFIKDDKEITHRTYEIAFLDNAKAYWQEHNTVEIYVDKSMKDVLEDNVSSDIKVEYKWDPFEVKHPIIAFSLEQNFNLIPEDRTNFYSFLMWYLHKENGILEYDYKEHSYTITGKKKEASGSSLEVMEMYATPPICIFHKPMRNNEKTLDHTANTFDQNDKENTDGLQGVQKETFDAKHYSLYPEHANEKVHSLLASDKNEIEFNFTHFTSDIQIGKLIPGSFICFKGDKDANWSQDPCFKDKNFRIRNLDLIAKKVSISEEIYDPSQAFQLFVKARIEEEESLYVKWPKFVPPTFPFQIPGTIFCDIGEEEQSTFKILESEKNKQGQYLVNIKTKRGEVKVPAPFDPSLPGQFYFPFIKDAEVMLEMYLGVAKIAYAINYDDLVKLTAGTQGNQIVLASNGKDKYTVMRHEYMDGKNSVFTVKQSFSETQVQTIEMKEKDILISVQEKDKKDLYVQITHEAGIVLSYEDKDSGVHQQFVFDGKSMTHTCKGSDGTSIITQKPDAVAIECKTFSIKAESIAIEASDSITQEGTNKLDIKSKLVDFASSKVKLG